MEEASREARVVAHEEAELILRCDFDGCDDIVEYNEEDDSFGFKLKVIHKI